MLLYFYDIIKFEDFHLDNILIAEKSYKNILVFKISYKTLNGAKSLCTGFNKIDGFIRVYDRTRYLVLFGAEKYDSIYNRIGFFIGVESGTYVFFLIIMQESKLIYMILCS